MTRVPALLQALRILSLVLLCTLGLAVRSAAQDMQFRSQHIFVVDHSYSMTETITGNREKMRWSFVVEKLQAWLETLPQDGSADVTILLFNQHVPGRVLTREKADPWLFDVSGWKAEDGTRAMGFVRNVGRPQDGEGTALWNSLGWAMRKVDAEGAKYAHSWIYLFTDGQDTNSGKQSGNPFSFEKGMAGSQPTLDAWLRLVDKHKNSFLIEQPLGSMEPPFKPEELEPKNRQIYTSRPELRDQLVVNIAAVKPALACVDKEQEIELAVSLAGPGKKRVPPESVVRVDFRAEDPQVQLEVSPATIPMRDGRHKVTVRRKGGNVNSGVKGVLALGFNPPDKTDLLGPKEIALQFAEKEKISIASVTPGGDLKVPVGREVQFGVQHTGESASWNFGDGNQADGNSPKHRFASAGVFEVVVTAKAADRDPEVRRIKVTAIAASVELRQEPEQGVIAGKAVSFRATTVASTATRYDWSVNGAARAPKVEGGSEIELRLEEPGSYDVLVRAHTEVGILERTSRLVVGEGLSLRIRSFQSSVDAGLGAEFGAEVKGRSKMGRVAWELVDAATGASVATGPAPIEGLASTWKVVVPATAPAAVLLRARAQLDDDEKKVYGEVVDEVRLSVSPPGVNARKETPADGEPVYVDVPTPFEAQWTGTGAAAIAEVRWEAALDGQPVGRPEVVQPSKSEKGVASRYVLTLGLDARLLGKRITVTATPGGPGVGPEAKAVAWQPQVRLPTVDYQIRTQSVNLGILDYRKPLQVQLEPSRYVAGVEWDWGDGKSERSGAGVGLDHQYAFSAGGPKTVVARIQREDGSEVVQQLAFFLNVPSLLIRDPGPVRVLQNVPLRIVPEELASLVTEVRWDFGNGYLSAESDFETTYMWRERAGPSPVRARVTLKDGTERNLPEITVNVTASRTVEAEIEVVGGESHGAVEMRARISEQSDHDGVEVDVLRDGQLLKTLQGTVTSHTIPEGEFGTYTFRFRAKRVPSPENPATVVDLGEVSRTYQFRDYVLALSVTLGALMLVGSFCWSVLMFQYPRKWVLRVTTKDPRNAESLLPSDFDSYAYKLSGQPKRKGAGMTPQWRFWQHRKHLDVEVRDLVPLFRNDEKESQGLNWIDTSTDKLRINPLSSSPLGTARRNSWEGPETNPHATDFPIYKKSPLDDFEGDKTLYAWLDARHKSSAGIVASVIILCATVAGCLWFAMRHCNVFI